VAARTPTVPAWASAVLQRCNQALAAGPAVSPTLASAASWRGVR
jgi:hypothetical protein